MKACEVRALIQVKPPRLDRRAARLDACKTVEDLHRLARRRLPRPVADYVDGGADEELTLADNVDAFRRWRFTPSVLVDVASVDASTSLLGRRSALPLGLAPTGYTRMISTAGEPAVAGSAARAGIPYVLSTMASTSVEALATHPESGGTDRWFQLYIWKDRDLTARLVTRAAAAGYRVLEIAVDTAVSGYRVRDVRNGLTIPPQLTLKGLVDIGIRPGYWTKMLASPALQFANVTAGGGYTIDNITKQFDPSVSWEDLARIRELWPGPVVLKGPLGPDDAIRARDLGVDGVHLSNHGGRQLDRTVAPIDLVAPVREAAGPGFAVFVDSGVRHGADIATALALGADAAFIGRPYLWGLVAGGRAGVDKVIELLSDQFARTMALLGVNSVDELRRRGTTLLQHR
ncbi:alpha-hydroxy-acid oxidizing protein [Mycobacterium sp. 21AC1]|uniref:alpha-hydroxy acid oxidase n=1 Tax=[Mycobacterium] appelbergii TaxID=2939269 RepID=UPI002938FC28|nr:alpha-hydroxy acid oxidase [Mycobacterium sp. 21AC1]MDV3127303.1 alpha-hydroxy-acid oxidizing protein [Mycobacterium sp. 21AC1]